MVFVKMKNDCGMVIKWILDNKKAARFLCDNFTKYENKT